MITIMAEVCGRKHTGERMRTIIVGGERTASKVKVEVCDGLSSGSIHRRISSASVPFV